MSVGHRRRVNQARRRNTPRLVGPRRWSLWTVSRPFLVYVLAVDAAAVAVIALTATIVPIGSRDLMWFAGLAVGSIVHLEVTRHIERIRELNSAGNIYSNFKSIWTFSALLLLPPPLVAALIVITYTHVWFRVSKRILVHRWVFSACNVVLASAAAGALLVAAYPHTYPDLPPGASGLIMIPVAGAVRWLVNRTFTRGALVLMDPDTTVRKAFGFTTADLIECGSLGLGWVVAVVTYHQTLQMPLLAVVVLVVHRSLLAREIEGAAKRDPATGLPNAEFWRDLAENALDRARLQQSTVGVLFIGVDDLDMLSRQHGERAANVVLRRVADVLQANLRRDDDLLGRLGDAEFGILLSMVTARDLVEVADRLQNAVNAVVIELDGAVEHAAIKVTVSAGGAVFPDSGLTLHRLLLVATAALFNAQTFGQGQARFARPNLTLRPATQDGLVGLSSNRQAAEAARRVVRGNWEIAVLTALALGPLNPTDILVEINSVEDTVGRREHKVPLGWSVLAKTLDRMEEDGLILRHDETITHPAVRYELTDRGYSLVAALPSLARWGKAAQSGAA